MKYMYKLHKFSKYTVTSYTRSVNNYVQLQVLHKLSYWVTGQIYRSCQSTMRQVIYDANLFYQHTYTHTPEDTQNIVW